MSPTQIVLAVVAFLFGMGLFALRMIVAPSALATFKEFELDLPLVTRLALHPASMALVLVGMASLVVAGMRVPGGARATRWLAAALGLSLAFAAFFLGGIYDPILTAR